MAEFASAIVALSVEFARTGKRLRRYVNTLTYAKDEMTAVRSDTKTCGNVLLLFGNALAEDDSPMVGEVHRLNIDVDLERRSRCLLEKLEKILDKRLKPMDKRSGATLSQRAIARCLWLFQKEDVEDLKKELGYVSALVHMCISLVAYGSLKSKMVAMPAAPPELKERIKALEKSLKTQLQTCTRLNEALHQQSVTQAAQAEALREMSQLLGTITQLAEREVRDSKAHRREERRLRTMGENTSDITESDTISTWETDEQTLPPVDRSASNSPQSPSPPPAPPGGSPSPTDSTTNNNTIPSDGERPACRQCGLHDCPYLR